MYFVKLLSIAFSQDIIFEIECRAKSYFNEEISSSGYNFKYASYDFKTF